MVSDARAFDKLGHSMHARLRRRNMDIKAQLYAFTSNGFFPEYLITTSYLEELGEEHGTTPRRHEYNVREHMRMIWPNDDLYPAILLLADMKRIGFDVGEDVRREGDRIKRFFIERGKTIGLGDYFKVAASLRELELLPTVSGRQPNLPPLKRFRR